MKKKNKICFINPHQFGHTAGYYYYCLYLKDKFDITYVCFDRGLPKIKLDGIKIIYIPKKKNKIFRIIYYLLQVIMLTYRNRYEIIYVYSFYFSFIIGMFSGQKIKIFDVRTGSISKKKFIRTIQNYFIKFNSYFFDRIVVLSKDLIWLLKLPQKKCHFVPLGAEIFFNGCHSFNKINLLYVGALNTRNIYQSIEGLCNFLNKFDRKIEIFYRIVGFGNPNEEKKIKNTIQKYKLNNYVSFEGKKTYEELSQYFEECNIGVSWIPITPAFNYQPATKTFEYILSGMFCIATMTKANMDLINEDNGVLCDDTPDSFAEALNVTYKMLNKLNSERISNTLKEYSWKNIVNHNLYPFLLSLIK